MSVFGDSDDDFELPSGGDDAVEPAPKKAPAPQRPGLSQGNLTRPAANQPLTAPPLRGIGSNPLTRPSIPAPAPMPPPAVEAEPAHVPAPTQSVRQPLPSAPRPTLPSAPAPPPAPVTNTPSPTLPPAVTQATPDRYTESVAHDENNAFGYDDIRPPRQKLEEVPPSIRDYSANEYDTQIEQSSRSKFSIDEDDDTDEDTDSRSKKRAKNRRGSKAAPKKKGSLFGSSKSKNPPLNDTNPDESPFFGKNGSFAGGRRRVLITNGIALSLLLGIIGAGVYPILNPPSIPSQNDVRSLVANQLNLTEFNKDGGRALVSAFVKEYFTFSDESGGVTRADRLAPFMDEAVASTLASSTISTTGMSQSLSNEPYITSITAIDDANGVYNVGVKIQNRWLYVDVPVFYDKRTLAYSISGIPTFTPPPSIAKVGQPAQEDFDTDAALQQETRSNITSFFKAWSLSDSEALSRYITGDADAETRAGLQRTVSFGELLSYEVETKAAEDPTENTRRAKATVSWNNAATNANLSYRQNFELELYRQPDDRWYVADIKPEIAKYTVFDTATNPSSSNQTNPIEPEPNTEPEPAP